MRGDDAAGLEVARRLGRRADGSHEDLGLRVAAYEGEAIGLLDAWEEAGAVIVVDAVRSGAPAGTVHRFDVSRDAAPAVFARTSSHTIGIAETIELARRLKTLPPVVILIGIEGHQFTAGAALSDEVAAALDPLVDRVADEARTLGARPPS